ncbi:MAG: M3 family oligoendopeptidase [Microthrixaceae bacterium]
MNSDTGSSTQTPAQVAEGSAESLGGTGSEDLLASNVAWDLDTLLDGSDVDDLMDQSEELIDQIETLRGKVAELDSGALAAAMTKLAELQEIQGRVGYYAMLRFSENTADPERGALMMKIQERSTTLATRLVFFELEWAAVDDDTAEALLADPRLDFCAHHLRSVRRYRQHLLSEPEEKLLTEKSVSGDSAWVRLFDELTSAITVELPAELVGGDAGDDANDTATVPLEQGLSLLAHPDRETRRQAAEAVTVGLEPGLRTRAFVFNTLLLDKSVDDRLRGYPSWISARNLDNEASDESVQALIDAVVARYDLPQKWYSLKAQILGVDRIADYDRMASVASDETTVGWAEAKSIVLDAYGSFSPELANIAKRFFDENWIDAPTRPGKRPGAFCAYTVPSHHPYVLLNWTSRSRDVSTLAHELGHGLHAYLAREQGVFHQSTPLTLAETASVFGETVTNNALLAQMEDPSARFALLAATLEDSIATVFRQVAMNRFEDSVHTARREVGEISVENMNELWLKSQSAMLGDSVELTDGYATWWSYIPHFIGTPGYVYAYAYGQLLALSVYARYAERGREFVPSYLELLSAGGSMSPGELGQIVDCDLEDPGFWDAGLDIVESQLDAATEAAAAAGRI